MGFLTVQLNRILHKRELPLKKGRTASMYSEESEFSSFPWIVITNTAVL